MIKPEKQINCEDDFEGYACDLIDNLCLEIKDNPKFIRPVTEDDSADEGIEFIYRPRAVRLIEDLKSRLYKIAKKHNYTIDIYSRYYIEL